MEPRITIVQKQEQWASTVQGYTEFYDHEGKLLLRSMVTYPSGIKQIADQLFKSRYGIDTPVAPLPAAYGDF